MCARCFRAEFGSFIFAILNLIFYSVLGVAAVVFQIFINVLVYSSNASPYIQYFKDYGFSDDFLSAFWCDNIRANAAFLLVHALVILQLVLGTLLLRGLCFNIVSNVRKFLVFNGIHNVAFYVIGVIITDEPLMVVPAAFYTLIMVMIYKAYRKMMQDKEEGFPMIDDDMLIVILD